MDIYSGPPAYYILEICNHPLLIPPPPPQLFGISEYFICVAADYLGWKYTICRKFVNRSEENMRSLGGGGLNNWG